MRMSASFCTNCGSRLTAASSVRCVTCGTVLSATSDQPTEAVPALSLDAIGGAPSAPWMEAGAGLEVVRGRNAGARFVLGERTKLGRNSDSDVFLDDVSVSRGHATIEQSPIGQFVISDAGSRNGTYLNDARVDQATLVHGDVLQIGMFKLVFFEGA